MLDQLEIALKAESAAYGKAIKTAARVNLAAARASCPEVKDPDDPLAEE